jgi:hypothetical protein
VFVVERYKQPVMPRSGNRPRLVLERGRAVTRRDYPFTIRLQDRIGTEVPDRQHVGIRVGRVATGAAGCFRFGKADGIDANHCKSLRRADGDGCGRWPVLSPATEIAGFRRGVFL